MKKIKSIKNRVNTAVIGKTAILLLLLIVSNVFMVLADDPGEPCDPIAAPIGNCPLDTWTMYLAIIAVIFAVFYLRKKNNASRNASL